MPVTFRSAETRNKVSTLPFFDRRLLLLFFLVAARWILRLASDHMITDWQSSRGNTTHLFSTRQDVTACSGLCKEPDALSSHAFNRHYRYISSYKKGDLIVNNRVTKQNDTAITLNSSLKADLACCARNINSPSAGVLAL